MRHVYDSYRWQQLRAQVRERDGHRCTVARLLGGDCRGPLHVHHIDPDREPYDPDNCATVCETHHPRWEAIRKGIVEQREKAEPAPEPEEPWRCHHKHPYPSGREECERRRKAEYERTGRVAA
jgi:hypothetical protein